jgi:hypothetical protein
MPDNTAVASKIRFKRITLWIVPREHPFPQFIELMGYRKPRDNAGMREKSQGIFSEISPNGQLGASAKGIETRGEEAALTGSQGWPPLRGGTLPSVPVKAASPPVSMVRPGCAFTKDPPQIPSL